MKPVILGVDPGTTVAFAVIDLCGETLSLESKRDAGIEWVVERSRQFGKPVLIACDVQPAPSTVIKLAASLNSRLYSPRESLTEAEKRRLVGSQKPSNVHERDALASAVKAFHEVENKLRHLERVVGENHLEKDFDKIASLALSGARISDIILDLTKQPAPVPLRQSARLHPSIASSDSLGRVRELLFANDELRKRVSLLEQEKISLQQDLSMARKGIGERVARDRALLSKDAEIARLRRLIFSLIHKKKKKPVASVHPKKSSAPEQKKQEHNAFKEQEEKLRSEDLSRLVDSYRRTRNQSC